MFCVFLQELPVAHVTFSRGPVCPSAGQGEGGGEILAGRAKQAQRLVVLTGGLSAVLLGVGQAAKSTAAAASGIQRPWPTWPRDARLHTEALAECGGQNLGRRWKVSGPPGSAAE